MNPEEFSPADLSAAHETLCRSRFDAETLCAHLDRVALLLEGLPATPTVPSLVFYRPSGSGVECCPIGAGVVVGRGEGCGLRFPERKELEFSRRHFTVRPDEEGFIVEDLGSANGITVNGAGAKVSHRQLRDGDLIRAAGVDFLFVRPEPV